ncbi:MAG: cell division protein FtsZ [Roseibacillus sp.]|nr:cell division protein FtsZ [Roseibacillus sp.]
MIPYERTRQQTIPNSAVKIIGVGGAGANMLDRIALDGMEGAELLACNTDVRTLTSSVAPEKIQLGRNLTRGLGAGGDPALGNQAAQEAELEIRDALRDRKIIFICVGLGGGTGSGAAPLLAQLARDEGAFTVVFATTPFNFEGARRREQAENALAELSTLANALITFDNTRMGELVLAKQGVHEAFSAADRMVSESIRAVTRIVMRPGLVNIGLDDLMAALSSPKSRCLFGSGIAHGENRAQQALKNALVSPLLDRGSLLNDTDTVLVHVCGGEDMTLYELELLMRGLSKHVPETAQILFGTSVDPAMAESLSVTLVSSLPEDRLRADFSKNLSAKKAEKVKEPDAEEAEPSEEALSEETGSSEKPAELDSKDDAVADGDSALESSLGSQLDGVEEEPAADQEDAITLESADEEAKFEEVEQDIQLDAGSNIRMRVKELPHPGEPDNEERVPDEVPVLASEEVSDSGFVEAVPSLAETGQSLDLEDDDAFFAETGPAGGPAPIKVESLEEIQASAKAKRPQDELALDGGPKGKFEGEDPNLIEGEDLDIPPFLRKKK